MPIPARKAAPSHAHSNWARWLAAAGVAAVVLRPRPAYAMHISDGFLPPVWSGLWFLAAAPFLLWGLWCLGRRQAAEPRTMTLVGLVGSAVFVISCLHVPIPWLHSCSHACGTGLAAILIGPGATVVVSAVALLFQWLLLGEGGVTTLGANLVSMGVVGALAGAACFHLLRRLRLPVLVAAFAAGTLSDWAVYVTSSFQLASALHGDASFWSWFAVALVGYVPTQLPLGILEGFLTALAYRFILVRRPELLANRARVVLLALVCLSAGSLLDSLTTSRRVGRDKLAQASAGLPVLRPYHSLGCHAHPERGGGWACPRKRGHGTQPCLRVPHLRLCSASGRLKPALLCSAADQPKPALPAWQAADDMVEQRFAAKGGTKPTEPAAEDRGELPGFFAMLAGAIGGFIAGYCFRALFPPRPAPDCRTPDAPREAEPTEPHAEREEYHRFGDPKPRTPENHAPGR
jgi:cobalt/nickel transport system permease protein